jgi:tryptophan 7-halogenase
MTLFRESGRVHRRGEEFFALASWVQVLVGQRIAPQRYHPLADSAPDSEVTQLAESVRGVIASCVEAMPTHEQFIDRYCRAPVAA